LTAGLKPCASRVENSGASSSPQGSRSQPVVLSLCTARWRSRSGRRGFRDRREEAQKPQKRLPERSLSAQRRMSGPGVIGAGRFCAFSRLVRSSAPLRSLAAFCKQQGIWRTLRSGFNRSSQRTAKAGLPPYSFCAFCFSRPSVQHRVSSHLLLGCVHLRLRIPTWFAGRSGLTGARFAPRSSSAPSERSPYLMHLRPDIED